MSIRRLVTSVCVLCLGFPAAAVASPGASPSKAQGPYGIAPNAGAPGLAKAIGPYGSTPVTAGADLAKARGPYGSTSVTAGPDLADAKGPYGSTPATRLPVTAGVTTGSDAAVRGDGVTGWRIVAILEAAMLAAIALGSLCVVSAGGRVPRTST